MEKVYLTTSKRRCVAPGVSMHLREGPIPLRRDS
jgi:hypothetical protein